MPLADVVESSREIFNLFAVSVPGPWSWRAAAAMLWTRRFMLKTFEWLSPNKLQVKCVCVCVLFVCLVVSWLCRYSYRRRVLVCACL